MHAIRLQSDGKFWTTLAACVCFGYSGCAPAEKEQVAQTSPEESAYAITVNRQDNGAALAPAYDVQQERFAVPRTLSFEMAGFAHMGTRQGTQEQRAAATQAAILDALCKALIEARRSRGQSDSDFTAMLGPRLKVSHCSTDTGYDVEVSLISGGLKTAFLVRDGVLQHPPRDLRMVNRIFDETNGEFSHLGTTWTASGDTCIAKVGCYLPVGVGEALARDATTDSDSLPPTP